MHIGLFFGSFNPVHVGHMIIANHMATHTDLKAVWMVVSPHNPLKDKQSLARDYDRLELVKLAIGDNTKLSASSIEFGLPKPNYTIDTLAALEEKYPQHQFSLIMGEDNLQSLPKWKNFELLIKKYPIKVYRRAGDQSDLSWLKDARIEYVDAPLLNISSTYIRQQIKEGKSIQYLVPDEVFKYLSSSRMYH